MSVADLNLSPAQVKSRQTTRKCIASARRHMATVVLRGSDRYGMADFV